MPLVRRLARFASATALVAALSACAGGGPKYPDYSPHENILSIAAEFQLLSALDPYRDPRPKDLTGQDTARATMIRLQNYESLHPERFTPEVLMLRARALEWLDDWSGAERAYSACTEFDTELKPEALRRAGILRALLAITAVGERDSSLEGQLATLEDRSTALGREVSSLEDPFYVSIALRGQETADMERADLIASTQLLIPDGERQAEDALAKVVSRHQKSARSLEHSLRLARHYAACAERELYLNPPGGSTFDQDKFRRNFDAAADLFHRISLEDGHPEKPIARAELDALLAMGGSL